MTFNQFPKCGTPIHKKQNFNLKFGTPIQKERNGQLVPIHDIQSISKIWDSYPQKKYLNLKEAQFGGTWSFLHFWADPRVFPQKDLKFMNLKC